MSDNANLKNNPFVAENWCHTRVHKVDQCSYMWTIHNYFDFHYHSGKRISSTRFKSSTNDKYEWSLQLDAPYSDLITLYLFCHPSVPSCESDVFVKCKVSVMNDEGEETIVRQQFHYNKLDPIQNDEKYEYYLSFEQLFTGGDLNRILIDDKLTIFCEFQFIIGKKLDFIRSDCGKSIIPTENDTDRSLRFDLESLFENEIFSDFVISADGVDFAVHKNILTIRSPVFAIMLQQDMKERNENRLVINDLSQKVVLEMLRYIYTGKVADWSESAGLLKAAEKYSLEQLKDMCQYVMIRELSVENVVDYLIMADTYHASFLKDQAIQFMKIHLSELTKTEFWHKLKESDLFDEVFKALFA